MVERETAKKWLFDVGVECVDILEISEGNNHDVFEVVSKSHPSLILKCCSEAEDEPEVKIEPLFGGEICLKRELDVFSALESLTNLRTPKIHKTDGKSFLLMEKLKGQLWCELMADKKYDKTLFLNTMRSLGNIFAGLHHVIFPAFGDFLSAEKIGSPEKNYASRFINVLDFRLQSSRNKGAITKEEAEKIREAMVARIEPYRVSLDVRSQPAVIVLDDLHPSNFFVDESGQVTGFFDIEFAQTAHPSLEYYAFCIFLFNYLDATSFDEAKAAFDGAYRDNGGPFDVDDSLFSDLTDLSSISRFLELTCSYYGVQDGLRDSWSRRYKNLIFRWIETENVDYMSAGEMLKEKFGHAHKPQTKEQWRNS